MDESGGLLSGGLRVVIDGDWVELHISTGSPLVLASPGVSRQFWASSTEMVETSTVEAAAFCHSPVRSDVCVPAAWAPQCWVQGAWGSQKTRILGWCQKSVVSHSRRQLSILNASVIRVSRSSPSSQEASSS